MRLACHSLVLGGAPVEAVLEHAAWAGFGAVELAAIPGQVEHVRPEMAPGAVAEIRARASDLGLRLAAVDVATHDRERIARALPLAAALGVPVLNVLSGGRPGSGASFARAVDSLAALAERGAGEGVRLAVKPHRGAAVWNVETAVRAVEAAGRLEAPGEAGGLGLTLDPSHLFRAGEDPVAAARALAPYALSTHLRDFCAPAGGDDPAGAGPGAPEAQVPGRGMLDLAGVLRALQSGGYGGAATVLLVGALRRGRPVPGYPLARLVGLAAESAGYLRRCLQ